jgi:protease-4
MAANQSFTKSLFIGIWNVLNFSRKLFFNAIFLFLLVFIIIAIASSGDDEIKVPKGGALYLNLSGNLVIQKTSVDPFDEFANEAFGGGEQVKEVLVRDVVKAINNAKEDRRISAILMDLDGLRGGGLDKLRVVAAALEDFKASGKPLIARGDFFGQSQYYLAAHADKIYLNPEGAVLFDGLTRQRMYYKEALEKLKINTHVFKVGTYKSAIEPYLRNDMSAEAREANQAWMGSYWRQMKQDIANARGVDVAAFDETADGFLNKFNAANGNFAQYALDNGWVDELKTREQIRSEMIDLVGKDDKDKSWQGISFARYMKVIDFPFPQELTSDGIAVVVAKGTILDGNQPAGTIGGESTARLLRKARLDNNVKAVVLHVDSPGGSAFASEIIRQEVEELKAANKPVVAVMSTYAASGGYWISASANKIIASPATITGSIGIFGMLMTYEDSLAHLGVYTDGVATTELGFSTLSKTLPEGLEQIIQRSIERGYEQFISLVADNRNMSLEQVDSIAQGRVWIGETALELGLVDALGGLDDGIKAAAELAGLETYDVKYIERTLSPKEQFIRELLQNAAIKLVQTQTIDSSSPLLGLFGQLVREVSQFARLNDPKATYAMCLECELR